MSARSSLAPVHFVRLWLEPPLAFARIGNSPTPLQAYHWTGPDLRPDGTGMTAIEPAPSLEFCADGSLRVMQPAPLVFRDEHGIRPVCPFFELHGEWVRGGVHESGAVSHEIVSAGAIEWKVMVANLKAFNLTLDEGDRIVAECSVSGDAVNAVALRGCSPPNSVAPLVPPDYHIALGHIRPARSSDDVPGHRLRFLPPQGRIYGSTCLDQRWDVDIPAECRFLNPASRWIGWTYDDARPRATPQGQYAADGDDRSYGVVDDMSDGIISCSISGQDCRPAVARIVVAPPDYAPDRRPFVSLADGLKDRVDRAGPSKQAYFEDGESVEAEVADLLTRIFETSSLINLDVMSDFHDIINPRIESKYDQLPAPNEYFRGVSWKRTFGLPLTDGARRSHRRLSVLRLAKELFGRKPELLDSIIRHPGDRARTYDHRMPAFMHGSDSRPLTLTLRQYTLLKNWVEKIGRS